MKTCFLFQEKKKREKRKGKKHYDAIRKLYSALKKIKDVGQALATYIILYIESVNSRVKLSIRDKDVSTALLSFLLRPSIDFQAEVS